MHFFFLHCLLCAIKDVTWVNMSAAYRICPWKAHIGRYIGPALTYIMISDQETWSGMKIIISCTAHVKQHSLTAVGDVAGGVWKEKQIRLWSQEYIPSVSFIAPKSFNTLLRLLAFNHHPLITYQYWLVLMQVIHRVSLLLKTTDERRRGNCGVIVGFSAPWGVWLNSFFLSSDVYLRWG